jgi:hypothetical protein
MGSFMKSRVGFDGGFGTEVMPIGVGGLKSWEMM